MTLSQGSRYLWQWDPIALVSPVGVHLVRACPTFENARWEAEQAAEIEALCSDFCGPSSV
jgi:hypothetical protein